jgi:transcriptional regulator with XRE-family HTH domain
MSEVARPARAGASDTALLGERLRAQRVERGLSQRELARRLEVSPSLVSQIETGKVQPSVRTLYAMASQLGVSLDDVFPTDGQPVRTDLSARLFRHQPLVDAPAEHDGLVQRGRSRKAVELETGVRWERLTTCNDREAEFLYTVYPPASESSPADALVRHNGREFGTVLSGRLTVTVGFDDHVLDPGDSIFFQSTVPHRLHNEGDEVVVAIWVVLGRQGD